MNLLQPYEDIIEMTQNDDKTNNNCVLMDIGIKDKAIEMNKRLFLETPQEQFDLLNRMDSSFVDSYILEDQPHILFNYCKAQKEGRTIDTYSQRIRKLYITGDLLSMHKERNYMIQDMLQFIPGQSNIVIEDELISGRNLKWIPIILSNIRKESCLIALGMLHLPGENGVLRLLQKEGYIVKPVCINQ